MIDVGIYKNSDNITFVSGKLQISYTENHVSN